MKFRKKPVVIDAVQFHGTEPHIDGVCINTECIEMKRYRSMDDNAGFIMPHIHTLEGIHIVSEGDWIITGVKGERYPCKPDIFEMTYEEI